ncbi:DUF6339 family protein [Oribacterium sp.]|jgi:hypothetical protein
MIHFKKMTKAQAKEFVEGIDDLPDAAFEDLTNKWNQFSVDDYDESYSELRSSIVETYKEQEANGGYAIDLNVGLSLYEQLNLTTGFTIVMANDDDIWRYIECKVFPDLTYKRYPKPAKGDIRINQKRFYSHTRRIWLKTLWWYVHLSWQSTRASTYKVLKDFGTDTISDFIERTGKGYRLILYRELMREYSLVSKKSAGLFNKIQMQNLVNCKTVEPALTENGEKGYVVSLVDQVISGQEVER